MSCSIGVHVALKTTTSQGDLRDRLHFLSWNVCVCGAEANEQRAHCFSEKERGGRGERESQQGPLAVWDWGKKDLQGLTLRRHQTAESQRDLEDRKGQRKERRKPQGYPVPVIVAHLWRRTNYDLLAVSGIRRTVKANHIFSFPDGPLWILPVMAHLCK